MTPGQLNLDVTKGEGIAKISSLYRGSLFQGSFSYILLLLG